jgi:hypothetical protein
MLDESKQQKPALAMRTWREVWRAVEEAASIAAARVPGGRGSSERAQRSRPGGVMFEDDDDTPDEEEE